MSVAKKQIPSIDWQSFHDLEKLRTRTKVTETGKILHSMMQIVTVRKMTASEYAAEYKAAMGEKANPAISNQWFYDRNTILRAYLKYGGDLSDITYTKMTNVGVSNFPPTVKEFREKCAEASATNHGKRKNKKKPVSSPKRQYNARGRKHAELVLETRLGTLRSELARATENRVKAEEHEVALEQRILEVEKIQDLMKDDDASGINLDL
jgi:hypothetical protein